MKKVSTQTTSFFSIVFAAVLGIFAAGELAFALISPETILDWLKNAHVSYYSASTAVAPKMTAYIMNQSFVNLFSTTYIRVMAMYIFVLCVPLIYALIHIFFISQNGSSDKPFHSSTNACLKTITLSFLVEFGFATVLFAVMKLTMRALPFYFVYTMLAVAIYSLSMVLFALTISGLINRMGDLKLEREKEKRKRREQAAAQRKSLREAANQEPETQQVKPYRVSKDFDDVLKSIDE